MHLYISSVLNEQAPAEVSRSEVSQPNSPKTSRHFQRLLVAWGIDKTYYARLASHFDNVRVESDLPKHSIHDV